MSIPLDAFTSAAVVGVVALFRRAVGVATGGLGDIDIPKSLDPGNGTVGVVTHVGDDACPGNRNCCENALGERESPSDTDGEGNNEGVDSVPVVVCVEPKLDLSGSGDGSVISLLTSPLINLIRGSEDKLLSSFDFDCCWLAAFVEFLLESLFFSPSSLLFLSVSSSFEGSDFTFFRSLLSSLSFMLASLSSALVSFELSFLMLCSRLLLIKLLCVVLVGVLRGIEKLLLSGVETNGDKVDVARGCEKIDPDNDADGVGGPSGVGGPRLMCVDVCRFRGGGFDESLVENSGGISWPC